MKRTLIVAYLILFIADAFANDAKKFFNEFMLKINNAEEICQEIAQNRSPLSQQSKQILRKLTPQELSSVLIYKSELAMHRCIIENGAYPDYLLQSLILLDETDSVTKDLITLYIESSKKPIHSKEIIYFNKLSDEIKSEIEKIDFFEKPFRVITLFQQISESRKALDHQN